MGADEHRSRGQRPRAVTGGGTATPAAHAAVDATAAAIRRLYFACWRMEALRREGVESAWGSKRVPMYDGGDTDSGTYTPIWPRIARLCLAEQAEPAAFVRAQFAGRRGPPPQPNALLGPDAVARWRASIPRAEDDARTALAVQRRTFVVEAKWRVVASGHAFDDAEAGRRVLVDRNVALSGLFRHCMATRAVAPAIAAEFAGPALSQYLFQRDAYDRAWDGWIPGPLRAAAAALVKAINARPDR